MAANKEINLKVCIIGDNEVGKSSLVLKHIRDKFSLDYNATAGILFIKNKIIVDGKEVSMQIYDTSGEMVIRRRLNHFYAAHVCALVYDVTEPLSFSHLKKWRQLFLKINNQKKIEDVVFAVLANKVDLDPVVDTSAAQEWCAANGILFFATSAKTGENLPEIFNSLAKQGKMIFEKRKATDDEDFKFSNIFKCCHSNCVIQ